MDGLNINKLNELFLTNDEIARKLSMCDVYSYMYWMDVLKNFRILGLKVVKEEDVKNFIKETLKDIMLHSEVMYDMVNDECNLVIKRDVVMSKLEDYDTLWNGEKEK